MLDVLVIGGGPAGASLAIRLARAGRAVAVLEKSAFPRAKVCGEFIAGDGLALLAEIGVSVRADVRRIALWASTARLAAPVTAGGALAREELDTLLLANAAAAGAEIYQPAKVLGIERTSRGTFRVLASCSGAFEARVVVAAHGSWESGPLSTQRPRTAPAASDLFGIKAHFRRHAMPCGTVALTPFAGGYAGALALRDDTATLACAVRRDTLHEIRRRHGGGRAGDALFHHALSASRALQEAFGHAVREGPWLAVGPLQPGARPLLRDGILAIGNAAGEVHPIVGEGIALALHSAHALADPLVDALEHGRHAADVAPAYRARYYARFRRHYWRSASFAMLAMHRLATAWTRKALARMPALLALAART